MFNPDNNYEKFENKVWLSSPTMYPDSMRYVMEAYETNWMSTVGANINEIIIKSIYRFLPPDKGMILWDGKDIFSLRPDTYPISYIPDTPVFYEELQSTC